MRIKDINNELIEYLITKILPIYDNFDKGHSREHAISVIQRSLKLTKYIKKDINLNMVVAIGAYHDVGIIKGRSGHPEHSREFVLQDENLKKFFNDEEIEVIAQACGDHSTSSKKEPSTIYGQIVCDADKDTDINVGLMRGWNYSLYHYPEMSFDEHIDDLQKEMSMRFGENGSVKFYIGSPENIAFFNEMGRYLDKKLLKQKMLELTGTKI